MMEKLKRYREEIIIFIILTGIYYLLSKGGMLKYAVVLAITAVVFLIMAFVQKRRIRPVYGIILLPAAVYIVWGTVAGAVFGHLNYYSIKQALFFLIPGIAAVIVGQFLAGGRLEKFVYVQFWAITAAFFMVHRSFTKNDWMESSYYAFILGAYVIFFLYKKNYLHLAASLVMFLLSHKRTVWGGAAACCIWLMIGLLLQKKKESYAKLYVTLSWIAAIVVLFVYVYICFAGSAWGREQLNAGISQAELEQLIPINTENRIWAWSHFIGTYEFSPLYLGQGFGWVLNTLAGWNLAGPYWMNLHNDFLASYIELGMIGYIIWLLAYGKRFQVMSKMGGSYSLLLAALTFYGFMNSMANNMLIHIPYLLPLFFMYMYLMQDKTGGSSYESNIQPQE